MARNRIQPFLLFLLSMPVHAVAQATPDQAPQRVTITGSRIPGIDLEDALPVVRIGREEIERSGAVTLEQLLWRLPANVNAFNEALSVGEVTRPGLSSANLRGLGGGSTLVLLVLWDGAPRPLPPATTP